MAWPVDDDMEMQLLLAVPRLLRNHPPVPTIRQYWAREIALAWRYMRSEERRHYFMYRSLDLFQNGQLVFSMDWNVRMHMPAGLTSLNPYNPGASSFQGNNQHLFHQLEWVLGHYHHPTPFGQYNVLTGIPNPDYGPKFALATPLTMDQLQQQQGLTQHHNCTFQDCVTLAHIPLNRRVFVMTEVRNNQICRFYHLNTVNGMLMQPTALSHRTPIPPRCFFEAQDVRRA